MYGRTTVQGSPFRVRCQPPKADTENTSITLMQENAFIDDTVKACVRTVDQFGEKCTADGMLAAQVLDAASEQVLFDAHIVETALVRLASILDWTAVPGTVAQCTRPTTPHRSVDAQCDCGTGAIQRACSDLFIAIVS
jgi:hypothetical protein